MLDKNSQNKRAVTTQFLARTAVIAALYTAITLLCYPIAFGPVQFRISEALTILPLFYIEAVPGLFIGCFLANIASGPWDMLIGSLATFAAAILTRLSRRLFPGVLPPIILNAFAVPLMFILSGISEAAYMIEVLTVGGGQVLSVCALGIPLYFALKSAVKRHRILAPTKRIKKRPE